jgi:hypothetical protein
LRVGITSQLELDAQVEALFVDNPGFANELRPYLGDLPNRAALDLRVCDATHHRVREEKFHAHWA